jgi:hypothetical protein
LKVREKRAPVRRSVIEKDFDVAITIEVFGRRELGASRDAGQDWARERAVAEENTEIAFRARSDRDVGPAVASRAVDHGRTVELTNRRRELSHLYGGGRVVGRCGLAGTRRARDQAYDRSLFSLHRVRPACCAGQQRVPLLSVRIDRHSGAFDHRPSG